MILGYCKVCGREILDGNNCENINNEYYCGDCAFIKGLITPEHFIKEHCYWNAFIERAVVHNGEVYIGRKNEKFDFEKTNRDYRHSSEYKEWRQKVFVRDNFTCQICNQVGGTLNAHHIKTFKKYPKLRFDVNNGITLCESCHKKLHKELRNKNDK